MMHKLSFDGIADLGAAVLASDDAVTVRVRAGRTGREVKAVVGIDPIEVSDYDRPSSLVRQIEKQLRVKLAAHFTRSFGADGVKAMLRASF